MPHARRFLFLSRSAVTTALAFAFVLLAGTALLTALSIRGVARAHRETVTSERQVAATTNILLAVALADLAARPPVASGAETYFDAYAAARENVRRECDALRREFARAPEAGALPGELLRVTALKLSELDTAVDAARHAPGVALAGIGTDAEGMRRAAEIQRLGGMLLRQELARRADISAGVIDRGQLLQSLSVSLIAVAVALAALGAWWLSRRVRDLEGLITVCAWTRRVQWQDRWVSFEEYLLHRFHLRCTHGICDEAAEKMRKDAAQMVLSLDLPPEMMSARPPPGRPILEPASDT